MSEKRGKSKVEEARCKAEAEAAFTRDAAEDNFEINSIPKIEFTRRANHIVGYLDKVTVAARILKDDIAIQQYLDEFILEQFKEFINPAGENKCSDALAVLLDYKEKNSFGFDPMDEFVLEI